MRRIVPIICTVALFAFASLGLAQTVATTPVGFTTATIPAAPSGTTPANTTICSAFYAPAEFTGAVSSVDSSNQISLSGAAFGNLTTVAHLARFKSGGSVGRFFVVTANSATQVTLNTAATGGSGYTLTTGSPGAGQTQVVAGDSVEILPANTFGSLFGTVPVANSGTMPFLTGATFDVADNIQLFNGATWDVYFHNGTNWRKTGSGLNQNNTVVLPDRGMFVIRRATSALSLNFLGTVPSTTEKTDFPGPGNTFKANRFPLDTNLLTLGLQTLPNWQSGATFDVADNVYLWNGTTWVVYFWNGTNWKKTGSGLNQNTTAVPTGTPFFVVRQSSASGATSTLTQTLPYTLN